MARKKASKKLTQLLLHPPSDPSLLNRIFLWTFRGDVGSALTIGILFSVSTVLGHILPTAMVNLQRTLIAVLALLIFGVFLGVIVVTETEKHYKSSGSRIRIITGAIGFCAISVMFAAPLVGVFAASVMGAFLGHFGIYWAKHL